MQKRIATITHIIDETHDVKTLRLALAPPMHFRPGQWLSLQITINGQLYRRPYSIGSAPQQKEHVDITFRRYDQGKVTPYLFNIPVGASFPAIGPFGQFVLRETDSHSVFIGAGTGVVPLMCMIRYNAMLSKQKKMTLLFSCKTEQDIIYRDELVQLERQLNDFTYVQTLTRADEQWQGQTARINDALIHQYVEQVEEATFYICGPPAFVADIKAGLTQLGVADEQIVSEEYD